MYQMWHAFTLADLTDYHTYHIDQMSEGTTVGGVPSVCSIHQLDSQCMSSTCGCFELWQCACVEWEYLLNCERLSAWSLHL